jgi:hypothetical protein
MQKGTKRYNRLISLGKHCQPAHQIRRFTGIPAASYFDWIGTSHEAILYALRNGLEVVFHKRNLRVTADGLGAVDLVSGVTYRHHFSRTSVAKSVDLASIELGYENQRKKFDFLRERWAKSVTQDGTLFIRQDCPTAEQVAELYEALFEHIGHERFGLLIITLPDYELNIEHPNIHTAIGCQQAEPGKDWTGDNDVWDKILKPYWQPAP